MTMDFLLGALFGAGLVVAVGWWFLKRAGKSFGRQILHDVDLARNRLDRALESLEIDEKDRHIEAAKRWLGDTDARLVDVVDGDEETPEYHEIAHGRMEREPWRDAP